MRAYLVVFDFFDGAKQIERIGVVLPGWTHDPSPLYAYLDTMNGLETEISFERISGDFDYLAEAPLVALWHWNDLFARDNSNQQESQGHEGTP